MLSENKTGSIWLVDDDSSIRWVLERALASTNLNYQSFASAKALLDALSHDQPDAIMTDIRMAEMDGLTLMQRIKNEYPHLPILITTAYSQLDIAVDAYQKGAFDYLAKPFDINEAIQLMEKAVTYGREQKQHSATLPHSFSATPLIIGEASSMQEVYRTIGRLSRVALSVLIHGESGTGKELVAQALHQHSPRHKKPFIALNMAAIPKELIEAELFGYEKGAFTGATQTRIGRFEQANQGTLFLDEIGDMPFDVQTRLLRVLAEGKFYRVGGLTPVVIDVRVIAATHQPLQKLIATERFREDLYHRLNVIPIHLPPLRNRKTDIPLLAKHFLSKITQQQQTELKTFHPHTLDFMMQLPWRGNVRELENVCQWLSVMAAGQEILITDLPEWLLNEHSTITESRYDCSDNHTDQAATATSVVSNLNTASLYEIIQQYLVDFPGEQGLQQIQQDFEQHLIACALEQSNGHKQQAAKLLGWGRNTLTRKLKNN